MHDPSRPISANNDQWWCLCDCAKEGESHKFVAYRSRLIKGSTQSCGCLARQRLSEGRTKHGLCSSKNPHPLYSTWEGIKQRCTNPMASNFKEYGGRGIKLCDRWIDFPNFVEDMWPSWAKGMSLDRITPNSNYSKEECKWSTPKEQANNRRTNVLMSINGTTKTRMQWSEEFGVPYTTIRSRINSGWTPEKAVSEPIRKQEKGNIVGNLEFRGKSQSVKEWALDIGLKPSILYLRIKLGWSVEKTLTTPKREHAPHKKKGGL